MLQTGLRSGPWACASIAAGGYRLIGGHDGEDGMTGRSRTCPSPHRYPPAARDAAGFVEAIDGLCRREGVVAVLPLSESVLHVLAERCPSPGGAILIGPTLEQYHVLCKKDGLSRAAAAAGVAHPAEVVVNSAARPEEYPPLPSIVKPLASATPRGAGVLYRSAVLVHTPADRTAAVERLVADTGGALVQEQVPGEGWRVDFLRSQGTLHAIARRVIRSYPPETGMSSVSQVVEVPPPGLFESARRLLETVDYAGPGSIQFLAWGGRHYVHDVNLRMPLSIGAVISGGLDLPRLAVDHVLGRLDPWLAVSPRPVRYTWFAGELQQLARAVRSRRAPVAARIVRDVALAAIMPNRVLDQLQFRDLRPTWELVRARARRRGVPDVAESRCLV